MTDEERRYLTALARAAEAVEPGVVELMIDLSHTRRGFARLMRHLPPGEVDMARRSLPELERWAREELIPILRADREAAGFPPIVPGSIFVPSPDHKK